MNFASTWTRYLQTIETAEVISILFPMLRKSLVLDTRSDLEDGPMARVVPMAESVDDRLRSIKRMRPRFPRPESVTIIPWPKQVQEPQAPGPLGQDHRADDEYREPGNHRQVHHLLREVAAARRRGNRRSNHGQELLHPLGSAQVGYSRHFRKQKRGRHA